MKYTIGIIFCLLLASSAGHSQFEITGKVVDTDSGLPLAGVSCSISGTFHFDLTNDDGIYLIKWDGAPGNYVLNCELFGYNKSSQSFSVDDANRNLVVNFEMSRNWRELPEVPIYSDMPPDTVFGSAEINVADFAFSGNNLLLLTYESELRWKKQEEKDKTLFQGAGLLLLDQNGNELARTKVPGEVIGFYPHYFNEIFLEGRHEKFYVSIQDHSIHIEKVEDDFFSTQVEPVIDTVGNLTILSSYDASYPAFEYLTFNRKDSVLHTLRYMVDEDIMEIFRSEYKYLSPREKLEAFRYQVKTGVDKEIVAAYMTGFQNSPYYEPVNAPLFVLNDTVLIFDHHHDKLVKLTTGGEKIDSLLISYHHSRKPEKWSGRLLRDKILDHLYTYYNRSGIMVLKRIDPGNGEIEETYELTYRYAEKIQVRDQWAYYIWRPYESSQKRFLYKEKLR